MRWVSGGRRLKESENGSLAKIPELAKSDVGVGEQAMTQAQDKMIEDGWFIKELEKVYLH